MNFYLSMISRNCFWTFDISRTPILRNILSNRLCLEIEMQPHKVAKICYMFWLQTFNKIKLEAFFRPAFQIWAQCAFCAFIADLCLQRCFLLCFRLVRSLGTKHNSSLSSQYISILITLSSRDEKSKSYSFVLPLFFFI